MIRGFPFVCRAALPLACAFLLALPGPAPAGYLTYTTTFGQAYPGTFCGSLPQSNPAAYSGIVRLYRVDVEALGPSPGHAVAVSRSSAEVDFTALLGVSFGAALSAPDGHIFTSTPSYSEHEAAPLLDINLEYDLGNDPDAGLGLLRLLRHDQGHTDFEAGRMRLPTLP